MWIKHITKKKKSFIESQKKQYEELYKIRAGPYIPILI